MATETDRMALARKFDEIAKRDAIMRAGLISIDLTPGEVLIILAALRSEAGAAMREEAGRDALVERMAREIACMDEWSTEGTPDQILMRHRAWEEDWPDEPGPQQDPDLPADIVQIRYGFARCRNSYRALARLALDVADGRIDSVATASGRSLPLQPEGGEA